MTSKSDNICAICCKTFLKPSLKAFGSRQNNFDSLFHLQNLFDSKVIQNTAAVHVSSTSRNRDTTSPIGGGRSSKREPKSLKPSLSAPGPLNLSTLSTAICPKCLSCMSTLLKKKDKLTSLEVDVRQLQIKLLKLLKDLQDGISAFSAELNNMEMIVENSHSKVANLDEFFEQIDEENGRKRGISLTLKDVIHLREIMNSVVLSLIDFNSQLGAHKKVNSLPPVQKMIHSNPESESCVNSLVRKEDNGIVPVAFSQNAKAVTSEQSEESEATDDDNFPLETLCDDSNDNLIEDDCPRLLPTHSATLKHKTNRKRSRNQSSKHMETNSDSEEVANYQSDHEDEYHPSNSKIQKKKKKNEMKKKTNGPDLAFPDFPGMSSFKKTFIIGIIKRESPTHSLSNNYKARGREKNIREDINTRRFDDIDPKRKHFITYDRKTDTLKLEDVEISIDEQEESLKCSKCNYKCPRKGRDNAVLTEDIYSHIAARHLNLLLCPYCPRNLNSYRKFRGHVLGHINPRICDICEKPLPDNYTLRIHKWSHLNEQEKTEAMKNGIKPPTDKKNLEKKCQCSICGKAFIFPAYLKRHEEETHQSKGRHLCPECGKRFKSRGYLNKHLKLVCCPVKPPPHIRLRFHCDQCPKMLCNRALLKEHKELCHSTEPCTLYKCSMCEKMFKTATLRRVHQRTHSNARPHTCEKGCGATYKTNAHCRRHEKFCGNNN